MQDDGVPKKYVALHRDGATSLEIQAELRADHVGHIEGIRILRTLFGLSLSEAKKIRVSFDGFTSIADYQEKIVKPLLEAAAADLDATE